MITTINEHIIANIKNGTYDFTLSDNEEENDEQLVEIAANYVLVGWEAYVLDDILKELLDDKGYDVNDDSNEIIENLDCKINSDGSRVLLDDDLDYDIIIRELSL